MDRDAERQVQEICEWLAYQVQHLEAQGAVLEVDGGIDSAVTAALAQRALGDTVLALIMPCQSSQQAMEDAVLVVNHLGMRHEVVDLNRFYNGFLHLLPKASP